MYRVGRSLDSVRHYIFRTNAKQIFSSSTIQAVHEPQSNVVESNQGGDVQQTPFGKLSARGPLAKNFFIGKVDNDLLSYPEPLSREELAKLKNDVLPSKEYFEKELDISAIDANQTIASQVLDDVRALGLYGANVREEFGGSGWNWTQSVFASEIEASCADIAMQLTTHRVIIDLLQKQGTSMQQQRYLPALASGSMVGCEAVYEMDAPEDDFFNTMAEYDSSSSTWTLSGHKAFAITGPLVSGATTLYVVIAQTQRPNMKRELGQSTTVFLVESDKPGVKLGDRHLTFGCRGTEMRHVHFNAVTLSGDCVVGEVHNGNVVADTLLQANRLRTSILGLALSKNILNELASNCRNTTYGNMELKDTDIRKAHLSKALCSVYAMESMLYLTTGLLDEFIDQDVSIECALTKYYTLTRTFSLAKKHLDIIGPKSLHSREPTEVVFRNTAQLYTQGESIDTLRLQIALMGLHHAGGHMSDTVRMSRNPLFHPTHILSRYLQSSNIDNPKTKMKLGEHLHPSLEPAAQCLEQSLARLQMCTELLFTRYGANVVDHHSEMERLSEIVSIIYSMYASAGRASRSYCIGLPLADHELLTATSICSHGRGVVYSLAKDIFNGHYENNDNNLQRLSRKVVEKGYFPTHPLTFNF